MFFRNLTLFRFPDDVAVAMADLDELLDRKRLQPCGPLELSTRGFVSPLGRDSEILARSMDNFTLFALGGSDKILPAAVVNEELAERLDTIADREDRRIGARERKRIKDEVLTDLVPRAFVRPSRTTAYVDRQDGWLVIDGTRRAAEEVIINLREVLGSFPATPLAPTESPRATLTTWLASGVLPGGLVLGDSCELRDPAESGAIVRCRAQDLELDEIKEHLKSGKQVFQLGLVYKDRISFVLGEDLSIRRLQFLEAVADQLTDADHESNETLLDSTFVLMTLELRELFVSMSNWFGITRDGSVRLDQPPTPKSMRKGAQDKPPAPLTAAVTKFAKSMKKAVGPGGSVTISGCGQSVTINADDVP